MKLYYNVYYEDEKYVPCLFLHDNGSFPESECLQILREHGIDGHAIAVCSVGGVDL